MIVRTREHCYVLYSRLYTRIHIHEFLYCIYTSSSAFACKFHHAPTKFLPIYGLITMIVYIV